MLLRLPSGLHYPITITTLLKSEGDEVKKDEPLFWYIYEAEHEEFDLWGNLKPVQRKYPTRFESTVDGQITEWKIGKGEVIISP